MRHFLAAAFALFGTLPVNAQSPRPMFERIMPPPQPAGAIPLYDGSATARPETEIWDRMTADGRVVVRNVTVPTVTPVLPPPGTATGAAVVVMPGGGFSILAMDAEGWSVARWLAAHGIAAFVVKYRLHPTPADEQALFPALAHDMGGLLTDPEATLAPFAPPAVADALQAIKLVRAGAARWHVDPARVGMIGFSSGAVATRNAALAPDAAARPAFFGYIYGPMGPVAVPSDAPPMFAALAMDDPLMSRQGFGVVEAWRKARRPVELHAYEKGGHGFGAGVPGTTTTLMLPEFLAWLQARGLLTPHR